MPKITLQNFGTGEISPDLLSRFEVEKVASGLAQCRNMIVDSLLGVKGVPGTQFRAECFDTEKQTRLIPFTYNVEQSYQIELSNLRGRVLKDGALVAVNLVDTSVFKWTASGAGTSEYYVELLAGGDPSLLEPSIVFEGGAKSTKASLGGLSAGEWGYGDNDTLGYSTVYVRTLGSTDPDTEATGYMQSPVLFETPYSDTDIQTINYTQSADTLYLFHGLYRTRKLTRELESEWTLIEIIDIDGPYKAREVGDENIRVNVTLVSGIIWEFQSIDSIFGDVEVDDPIRVAFPIPGAPESLHWTWFKVTLVSTDKIIRGGLQNSAVLDNIVPYQQIVNYNFNQGLAGWQDTSGAVSNSFIKYDFGFKRAVMVDGAGDDAKMEQAVTTFPNVMHRFEVSIAAMNGATPTVTVKIGTSSGAGDIYTSAPITTATTFGVNVKPTQETVYVNFDSVGSANSDEIEIAYAELYPRGNDHGAGTEHTTTDWRLAAWNSNHGFPQHGVIHEQRLFSAKNAAKPQTIWPSETGNFESHAFNTPSRSTDAFSFFPPTTEINGIEWLLLHNGLNVGTAGELWKVFASSGGVVTPSDVNIKIDSGVGSLDLSPVIAGNSIIMTPRGLEAVSELTSSFETSGYVPRDISYLAKHLFKDRRIVRWAFARNPDSIIWCVLDNGVLLGLTYIKAYDIWAWHKHTTELGEGYKDVSVIPNSSDDNIDDVYFVINRAETGATPNYYIETLNKDITPQEAAFGLSSSGSPHDYRFLHSAIDYDDPQAITGITNANPAVVTSTAHGYSNGDLVRIQNVKGMTELVEGEYVPALNNNVYKVANKAANIYELNDEDDNTIDSTGFTAYIADGESREMVTVLSGFDHLEGETITALADGVVRSGLTVSGGSITLPQAASFAHGGVPYEPLFEGGDIEAILEIGTTQGKRKAITGATIYFSNTREAQVAINSEPAQWEVIDFNDEKYGEEPPPLVTESKEVTMSGNSRAVERIKIRQVSPLPIHITRIVLDVKFSD